VGAERCPRPSTKSGQGLRATRNPLTSDCEPYAVAGGGVFGVAVVRRDRGKRSDAPGAGEPDGGAVSAVAAGTQSRPREAFRSRLRLAPLPPREPCPRRGHSEQRYGVRRPEKPRRWRTGRQSRSRRPVPIRIALATVRATDSMRRARKPRPSHQRPRRAPTTRAPVGTKFTLLFRRSQRNRALRCRKPRLYGRPGSAGAPFGVRPFIEEGVLVGDGLTILPTSTIKDALVMEEEPFIK
jgi:hypothetical protein